MKILFTLALILLLLPACIRIDVAPGMRRGELKQEMVIPPTGWFTLNKVAIITLSGEITGDERPKLLSMGQSSSVLWIKDQLKKAEADRAVRAVVLRIDSPGGDVTASDIIYREIKMFKERRKIPVLASIMDMGASGGYYVALSADRIYAHPTSVTGSIGVMARIPEIDKMGQKIGVEMRVIKSGEHKDLGSIWRAFAPGEQDILQNLIQQMYERFVGIVAENRPGLDVNAVRALADGRVYTAQQAKANGLIDDVKYLDQVIDLAKAQAGMKDAAVVMYKRPNSYRGNIYAQSDSPEAKTSMTGDLFGLGSMVQEFKEPAIQYMWKP